MLTFLEVLALVESESSFGAYVCHRRPGGSIAISDLVNGQTVEKSSLIVYYGKIHKESCTSSFLSVDHLNIRQNAPAPSVLRSLLSFDNFAWHRFGARQTGVAPK